MLDAQNLRVAMVKDWLKPLKAALVPADGINDKMTRGIEHDLMACEPFDDDQRKIHPGHHAACGDKVLVFDHQPVRIKLQLRPILAQLRCHAPMGGDRATFVDASGRDPGDADAGGADQTALRGAVFEPGQQRRMGLWVDLRRGGWKQNGVRVVWQFSRVRDYSGIQICVAEEVMQAQNCGLQGTGIGENGSGCHVVIISNSFVICDNSRSDLKRHILGASQMESDMTDQTHTLPLGRFEVTTYSDGQFVLPSGYFANVPEDVALGAEVTIGANLWVVRSEDRVILVDTGSADALKARFPSTGQAWDTVQGVAPTDIVLTHMHADHLGGFLDGGAFGGATIHVAQAEWDFWTNPDLVNAVDDDTRPMVEMIQNVAKGIADRVQLFEAGQQLAPGVRFVALPGHTSGHSGLCVEDGGEALLIIGDAVISEALQFAHPEVAYALDGDAAMAAETRRALLAQAVAEGTTIAATHFAFPGIGKVAAEGAAFRFVPI